MQNNKRACTSLGERELLHQFGIKNELQIKLCQLKFYTFKGVAGSKCGTKLDHLSQKLAELPIAQINSVAVNSLNKINPFKCSQCRFVCKYPSRLKNHLFVHLAVKPKPFKCELCKYSARYENCLVRHMRTHTGEKPFKCALCISKFVTKIQLTRHIRTHTGEKFYGCQFCKKQFAENCDKKKLENVCKINPNLADAKWVENQKKCKCTNCSYSAICSSRLKVHLKTHTDEKEFECKLCTSKYKSSWHLRRHIVTHTGEKPFFCQFCKRAFSHRTYMNSHENNCKLDPKLSDKKYVELLKKFKCHKCSYSCRTKNSLDKHVRIHTGENKCACPFCSYKCWNKYVLNLHIRTHIKEKPFKCPHCEFTTGQQGNLKQHVNAWHYKGVRRKNFSCEICSRSYFKRSTLTRHVLRHTEERPQALYCCKKRFLHKYEIFVNFNL